MSNFVKPDAITLILTEKNTNIILHGIPTIKDQNIFLEFYKHFKVKHLFIACELDPSLDFFRQNGIEIHSIEWEDGNSPPETVVTQFLEIFLKKERPSDEFIAVSCRRGFGRAPTLAAISLIEKGFSPINSLTFLRKENPRFITERQKSFILQYKPIGKNNNCKIN